MTFVDRIPNASILRAITLPPYGGTTTWACTETAYDRLQPPRRALVENLWAVHTNQYDYATLHDEPGATPTAEQRAYRNEFVADYDDHYRRLNRITLAGDIPVDVHGRHSRAIAGDASTYSDVVRPVALAR